MKNKYYPEGTILFYSSIGEYGCFSNFSRHPVKVFGKTFPTSEHAFQSQKFAGTSLEEQVRKAKGPAQAAAIGRDRKNPLRKDWEAVKDNIMRETVYAKFSQHEHLKQTLISTNEFLLVEHTERDRYWGDGGNRTGKNMLGVILMEVRNKLRKE